MSLELLDRLTGDDDEFARGLVELGWYDYAPVLTDYCFMGKARACLNPRFKAAGEVRGTDAWVYRLELHNAKWQDAVAVVESHLKQEPQFAVVFCNLPGALLILVPSNPDKAFGKAKSGLTVDRIYLDTRHPSNFETETIKKLMDAPKKHFRARLQEMVNTERVTKKFYDRFKKELDSFQKLIDGITVDSDRLWYSSVMLNRLMFIYFLQRKGFLDGDDKYLSNRLKEVQERRGKDEFQSFYRCFLLRLFHEGLGSRKREVDFEDLLGRIPYLNGGLFELHEIESRYVDDAGETAIDIPDEAFKRVFDFFDEWEWCLDTRPSRTENEINPDVLGYIFEKYINQKQMGAYYTKEDITDYISKNTIIPYLFDATRTKRPSAFEGEDSVWRLLKNDPNRYIYEAVQKGVELDLPEYIACGLDDVSKRDKWNTPAPEEYALPTEIWREVVSRRQRCTELRAKLESGDVQSIDDLITYNLDIKRFAQDVIDFTDDPELVRHIWNVMAGRLPEKSNEKPIPPMSILDPTCGSGAFLFAALNILEPLYEKCMVRMQQFVSQADASGDSAKYPDFRRVLAKMNDTAKHPNRKYFILKSIILGNLYGVDIMEEAVEICKLRLFLTLAAQVEPDDSKENYGLEPLPDIDFNIRSGNTLVGFATREEVRKATSDSAGQSRLDLDGESEAFKEIDEAADLADRAFQRFHEMQVVHGMDDNEFADAKQHLRARLKELSDRLNVYLAKQYVIDAKHHSAKYDRWLASHQPFHWFVEFYGIMRRGGFDVIIGNPPYVEYRLIKNDYSLSPQHYLSEPAANLYAFCMERSAALISRTGRFGMIVPTGLVGLDDAKPLRELLLASFRFSCSSTYGIRPSKLFDGVDQRLCIYVAAAGRSERPAVYSTRYHHWHAEERAALFDLLQYVSSDYHERLGRIPQAGCADALSVLSKLEAKKTKVIRAYKSANRTGFLLHYHRSPRYWIRSMDFEQYFKSATRTRSVHHFRDLYLRDAAVGKAVGATLNSTLFFFWFISMGNGRNITGTDVTEFPIGDVAAADASNIADLFDSLMTDYKAHSFVRTRKDCEFQEFQPSKSKPLIDEIDRSLGRHYGFTDEELDFIINYDIKYRMGINGGGEAGDCEEDDE